MGPAFESLTLGLAPHAELLSETDFLEPGQLVTMSTHVQLRLCEHVEQLAGQPTLDRRLFHLSLILVPTFPLLSEVPPKVVQFKTPKPITSSARAPFLSLLLRGPARGREGRDKRLCSPPCMVTEGTAPGWWSVKAGLGVVQRDLTDHSLSGHNDKQPCSPAPCH